MHWPPPAPHPTHLASTTGALVSSRIASWSVAGEAKDRGEYGLMASAACVPPPPPAPTTAWVSREARRERKGAGDGAVPAAEEEPGSGVVRSGAGGPGGVLVLTIPYPNLVYRLVQLKRRLSGQSALTDDEFYESTYTRDQLIEQASAAGFEVLETIPTSHDFTLWGLGWPWGHS